MSPLSKALIFTLAVFVTVNFSPFVSSAPAADRAPVIYAADPAPQSEVSEGEPSVPTRKPPHEKDNAQAPRSMRVLWGAAIVPIRPWRKFR